MRVLNLLQLLLLTALWGDSFLFFRIASPVLGPVWLIEARVLLAGLTFLPWLVRLDRFNEVRKKLIPLFVVGCINSAMPFLLLAFTSLSLPARFTSILNATAPLFGTVVALVWLKEKLTLSRMVGFVLGFAGVIVLVVF
jgi:drug/metabolite transporter (DMT)-like permease